MPLDVTGVFLLFLVGIILFVIGKTQQDATIGILGGLWLMLLGVIVLINHVSGIEAFTYNSIGTIIFGIGAYIFVRGGVESIK